MHYLSTVGGSATNLVRFQTPEAFPVSAFDGFVRLPPYGQWGYAESRVQKKDPAKPQLICANLSDLWESTKRPMRLKKHVREYAHRSQTITDAMRGGGQKQ